MDARFNSNSSVTDMSTVRLLLLSNKAVCEVLVDMLLVNLIINFIIITKLSPQINQYELIVNSPTGCA